MDFPKFPQKKTSSATMSKTRDGQWSMIKIASISFFFCVWSFTCVHLLLCIFSSSFLFFASVFLWWTFCCGQSGGRLRESKRETEILSTSCLCDLVQMFMLDSNLLDRVIPLRLQHKERKETRGCVCMRLIHRNRTGLLYFCNQFSY